MMLHLVVTKPDDDQLKGEVQRWYSAPDARCWMGDGFDVDAVFRRMGTSGEWLPRKYRHATLGWVGINTEGRPVAFLGGDVIVDRALISSDDRPPRWEEVGPRTLGFTYVVAPEHQRKGHGRKLVRAVLDHPDLAGVDVLSCSIDRKNEASLKLIRGIPEFRETGGDEKSAFFAYERSSRPHSE